MSAQLDGVRSEMTGEPTTKAELAEDQIARRVNSLISELDEFMAMAANPETADLIENERLAFGQVHTRASLILSFLHARKPPKFRMIQNG